VYLSTPVFGQPAAARAKQLVVVSSGDQGGRERVLPLLQAIGKKVIDVGEDNAKGRSSCLHREQREERETRRITLTSGVSLKLLGNGVLLGAIQLYAEVYALSDAIGFDPAVFHELHRESCLMNPRDIYGRKPLRCARSAELQ